MIAFALLVLLVCSGLLLFRVINGPGIQDRIVAADALSVILAMVIVLLAVHYGKHFLLDVCLVYALLSFVDVLIMVKFFEQGELHR